LIRAFLYGRTAPTNGGEPVEGSARSKRIGSLYAHLVRHYVDRLVALDIVRMFNETRCRPPLNDTDVVKVALWVANEEADRREEPR
jgi:hypothetical protein